MSVYLDGGIACGQTFEDVLKNLGEVIDRLETAGLKPKAKYCQMFHQKGLTVLGMSFQLIGPEQILRRST